MTLTDDYNDLADHQYSYAQPTGHVQERKKKLPAVVSNPYRNIKKTGDYKMTEDNIENAKLVKASYTAYSEGLDKAQTYLDENTTRGWKVLEESTQNALALRDRKGVVKMAYRGTKSADDILTDIKLGLGETLPLHEQTQQLEDVLMNVGEVDQLVAHSLGGTYAIDLGDTYNIDTETFNPFIAPSTLENNQHNPNVEHNVITTADDWSSIGQHFIDEEGNFNVHNITTTSQDGVHSLNNFTNATPETQITDWFNQVQDSSGLAHEAIMMDAMTEHDSFTDFVSAFSGGDIDADGKFGSRINEEAPMVSMWEDTTGIPFTTEEQEHLNNTPHAPEGQTTETHTTPEQTQQFLENQKEYVENALTSAREDINSLNEQYEPHTTMADHLQEEGSTGIHGGASSLVAGLVGSLAGEAVANWVDPNAGVDSQEHGLISTTTASIITEAGSMGAGAGFLPAVVAGVGGYEAQKYTDEGLENIGVDHVVAVPISSAIGGGVAGGLYTAGGALASAVLTGAEIGSLLAPETLGLSVLIGAGVGLVAGTISVAMESNAPGPNEIAPPNPHPVQHFLQNVVGMGNETAPQQEGGEKHHVPVEGGGGPLDTPDTHTYGTPHANPMSQVGGGRG